MADVEFEFRGDDLRHNIDLLGEIMGQAPPDARMRARAAAKRIEAVVIDLTRGNQDPAVTLGITLALHLLTQHMVEKTAGGGQSETMIQLLS